ncbi:MAG: protein kinase [Chloroflexi bacterium]|nr:protein kinase [Chloroflexota bacterium]MBP8059206.1 protein kinase [Chloroflexota bacterium]
MSRICPQCNAPLRLDVRFCTRCGGYVQTTLFTPRPSGTECPFCQVPNRPEARYCQKCRHPFNLCPRCQSANRLVSRFCQNCGSALHTQVDPTQSVAPPDPAVKGVTVCLHCGRDTAKSSHFCEHCGEPPTRTSQRLAQKHETGKLPLHFKLQGTNGEEYLVVSMVAKGGMGAVYKVLRARDQTRWALKEMSESALGSFGRARAIEAFHEEARYLQTLHHIYLPQLIDVFADKHRHYMVMEFVEGHTLAQLLVHQPELLTVHEVLEWARQLCQVLHYLHHQSPPIIYRDLKPANIMLETATNRIKLIDFGIARRFKGGQRSDTILVGTFGYAAPEQYGDRQTDARSDLYGLGATLHHLLTGVNPQKHTPFTYPPIQTFKSDVPERVCRAIDKAVQRLPENRHQTAAAMHEALFGQPLPPVSSVYASGSPVVHLSGAHLAKG